MKRKLQVGFIGAGNMGNALMSGMAHQICQERPVHLLCYDIAEAAAQQAAEKYQAEVKNSIAALVQESEIVWIAVKPQFLEEVLPELRAHWTESQILVSIVAGKSISYWQNVLGKEARIARVMPNTPALVQQAMNTVCFSDTLTNRESVLDLLSSTGRVMQIREDLMDAAMGVAGCGPAFVYLFIEALADAGVAEGLFRAQAYELAAQTVLGAAQMVLETGMHPGALKDAVCSPGGTTIQGVMALEQAGFRSAVQQAVVATVRKVQNL